MPNSLRALLLAVAVAWSSAAVAYIDLAPVADTYIQAGATATLAYGGSTKLKVDRSPRSVSYLAFDLSGVTAPVVRATLVLSVTNTSPDGGRVYQIPTSSWVEGTAVGAAGPGLTWVDVDLNGDGVLDARDRSPLTPDPARVVGFVGAVVSGQTVEVDVTPGVVAGPAVYTLAIMNASTNTTTFRSREATSGRPLLRVDTADQPTAEPVCGDGVLDPAETCDGGADASCPGLCRADCTCDVPDMDFTCLGQAGPLVTLDGSEIKYSNRTLLPSTRIDARAATFFPSPANSYPFSIDGGKGICVAGVKVLGQYDRSLDWETIHGLNNAGVTFKNAATIVDGARIDDVTDAIRPRDGAAGFVVRGSHLSYVRDDCVENDDLNGGLVTDSLFDGCYVGFSARPDPADTTSDGRRTVWTIEHSLVRLEPMPGARPGSVAYDDGFGHGPFFKWDHWNEPVLSRSPRLVLRHNVFRADRVTQEGARRMGIPPAQLLGCEDNVMVWLGPGDYPTALPGCFTVTKDVAVWDAAVTAWKLRHP